LPVHSKSADAQVPGDAIHAFFDQLVIVGLIKCVRESAWIAMGIYVARSGDLSAGLAASDGPSIVIANSLPNFASPTERHCPLSSFLAISAGWLEAVDDRRVASVRVAGGIIVAGNWIKCMEARYGNVGRLMTKKYYY